MNSDMRVKSTIFSNPKISLLEEICGYQGTRCLFALWAYTTTEKPNGDLSGVPDFLIERASGWKESFTINTGVLRLYYEKYEKYDRNGVDITPPLPPENEKISFIFVLRFLHFLDGKTGNYYVHDWEENNPYVVEYSDKGDKNRLNILSRNNPAVYSVLKGLGVQALTSEAYKKVKGLKREEGETQENFSLRIHTTVKGVYERITSKPNQTNIKTDILTNISCPNFSKLDPPLENKPEPLPQEQEKEPEVLTSPAQEEKTKKKPKKKKTLDDFSEEISSYVQGFQTALLEQNETKAPKATGSLFIHCADTVEKLIRIDGFTLEKIKEVATWARQDDFWQSNFYSLAGLREKKGSDGRTKFQKILSSMDRTSGKGGKESIYDKNGKYKGYHGVKDAEYYKEQEIIKPLDHVPF